MDEIVESTTAGQVKFISKKSPDYRLEFINGAVSNITPRGEIVCEFHFESKDMPTVQVATIVGDKNAKFEGFKDTLNFTRDVKFGIVMNSQFAKDLIEMLNKKIKESEMVVADRVKGSEQNGA
jgi:hypothetical protein